MFDRDCKNQSQEVRSEPFVVVQLAGGSHHTTRTTDFELGAWRCIHKSPTVEEANVQEWALGNLIGFDNNDDGNDQKT